MRGGAGNDKLTGGSGNDVCTFGNAEYTSADTINGGVGTDTIKLTADSDVVATNVTNVEILLLDSEQFLFTCAVSACCVQLLFKRVMVL